MPAENGEFGWQSHSTNTIPTIHTASLFVASRVEILYRWDDTFMLSNPWGRNEKVISY